MIDDDLGGVHPTAVPTFFLVYTAATNRSPAAIAMRDKKVIAAAPTAVGSLRLFAASEDGAGASGSCFGFLIEILGIDGHS